MRTVRIRAGIIPAMAVIVIALSPCFPTFAQNSEPRVTGRVVDTEGRPIADAVVALTAQSGSYKAQLLTAMSDSEGKFALNPTEKVMSVYYSVLAWKPGFGLGLVRNQTTDVFVESGAIPTARNLSITLPEPKRLTLRIVDVEGRPVTRTKVTTTSLSQSGGEPFFYWTGEPTIEFLTQTTDDEGRLMLDYLPSGTVASLMIQTAKHGSQIASVSAVQIDEDPTLRLLPSSQLKITLVTEDSTNVAERKIVIYSRLPQRDLSPKDGEAVLRISFGMSELVTDQQGQASDMVLAGKASIEVESKQEDTSVPDLSAANSIALEPGATSELTVFYKPGKKFHGRVVDTEGSPVAGAQIAVFGKQPVTNEDGRYATFVPATGPIYASVQSVPDGYVMPWETYFGSRPTDDDAASKPDIEQPDIVVSRAASLSGKVVDDQGRPVAAATINAAWVQTDPSGQTFTRRSEVAESDDNGDFRFAHVLADVDVRITAQTEEMASAAEIIHTEGTKQVELQVTSSGMLDIVGVIKGSDGKLVNDVEIKIKTAMLVADGGIYGQRQLRWNGKETFRSNDEGAFRSPRKLPRFDQYSLTIAAPGYLSSETTFLKPKDAEDLDLGETILTKARIAAGVVVDSVGKPLPGAKVSAYSSEEVGQYSVAKREAVTDADGRFSLNQLHPRSAMALVEKEGYRLSGGILLINQPQLTLTLYGHDEVPAKQHRVLPAFDNQAHHPAAKDLVGKLLSERRSSNYFGSELYNMLLRVDREAALAQLDDAKSASTRANVLAKLGEVEDALAEVVNIEDAYTRCYTRLEVVNRCDDPELARDVLATVLVDAESIRRPDRRLVVIGQVADGFRKLGDKDYAEQIIKSQTSQAEALSTQEWPGYARASFAERLSEFDFETAIKMVDQAEEDDRHRHFQNIAHRLADKNPAAAEQTLKRMTSMRYVDAPVVRVGYRMARVDLPRALRLLETIDQRRRPVAKARALGVMAYALKDENLPKSRELLQQAFAAIPVSDPSMGHRADDYFGAAMTLLRYAEQIDPEQLTDYFWQTVKTYPGPRGVAWSPDESEVISADRQARLAILAVLYGQPPELATQIMGPVFAYWEKQIDNDDTSSRFTDRRAAFTAMALADPKRAVDWSIRFDEKLDKDRRRHIPQPWQVIGNTLTQDRDEIGKRMTREVFHRWVIDEHDF